MEINKPKGITSQLTVYVDAISQLRAKCYTWGQLVEMITLIDKPLGDRLNDKTLRTYYVNAQKKLARGNFIIEQESLTKAKRGPKPKITAIQDTSNTEPEPTANTPAEPSSVSHPAKPVVHKEEAKLSSELTSPTPQTAPSTSDLVSRLLSGKTRRIAPVDSSETESVKQTGGNVFYIDLDD